MISVPIQRNINSLTRAEKMIPIPIRIGNHNFMIDNLQPSLIMANGESLPVIQSISKNCLSENNLDLSNCLIRVISSEVIPSNSCLSVIHEGGSVGEYKKLCKVSSQLNSTHWIYNGPQSNITISCFNKSDASVLLIGGASVSNVVTIPCNCWTENGLIYSSPSLKSCLKDQPISSLDMYSFHVIPFNELRISPYKLESSFELSRAQFSPLQNVSILNYSSDIQKINHLLKSIEKPVPIVEWTSPYHSIWYYASLILGIGATIVLLICCLSRNRQLMFGSTLLSYPSSVKAESLPAWVEVTYDFIVFIILLGGIITLIHLIKKILKGLSCHNCYVLGMERVSGLHYDVIILDGANQLVISLKRLPGFGFNYLQPSKVGRLSAHGGMLTLNDFSDLEDLCGNRLIVNGTYSLPKTIEFPTSRGMIRIKDSIS